MYAQPTGSSSFACNVEREGVGGGFVKPYLHMLDAPSRGSDVFISLFATDLPGGGFRSFSTE